MIFKKKPIVINAFQFDGDFACVPEWATKALNDGILYWDSNDLNVNTLEGVMKVCINDYIIKGIKGELYPCKPDIFLSTYEQVVD